MERPIAARRPPPSLPGTLVPTIGSRVPRPLPGPAEALAIDLLNTVRGEVRFDAGSRALYATDASNYRHLPIGVVLPLDGDDVAAAVEVCRRHGAPIVSRGGGTSLAGQTCNVAVVLDHSKHHDRVLELDPARRTARVQPGVVLDTLRDAAEVHGLTFGPDPATHDHCTLGGMIGNNSCGVHSVMAGKTSENVDRLDVLTYDGLRMSVGPMTEEELGVAALQPGRRGAILHALRELRDRYADDIRSGFPDIPRRVSGYDLPWLLPERGFHLARALVGSESTLVTVLEATVRLVPSPAFRALVAVGYPDVFRAADDVPAVIASGCIACEGLDEDLVRDVRRRGIHEDALSLLPAGRGFLMVEFGGDTEGEARERADRFADEVRRRVPDASSRVVTDPAEERLLWKVRESGLGATAMVPGQRDNHPGWEDSAVPPERLGEYLREVRRLWDRYGYHADMYGHFGQGVLHCRVDFDLVTGPGIERWRRYLDEAADLVVRMGGSLSGEHGDGQGRAELLPRMFSPRLMEAFRAFKAIWDPDGRMNPGRIVDPRPITADLRLGADFAPPVLRTWFRFPEDEGSMAHAARRCVGVGECRRHDGGVMCPSYMATREEAHSTRGRAHLLFELLNGRELADGWRDDDVEEALDLCLACKGCKGECPVNVDMATLKAEFRAHHFAGRPRPRAAYSMGLIHWWARLAAHAPGLANAAAGAPVLGRIARAAGGIAPEREIPRFAPRTFRRWWQDRGGAWAGRGATDRRAAADPGQRVVLWVDTFNDHFRPAVLQAAVTVLEDAGLSVAIPRRSLCCGRPLYDWGFLAQAKGLLVRTILELRDEIRAGVPIVGAEPSCVSVFRDEAPNLLHGHEDARRIADVTRLLPELLADIGYTPPSASGRVVLQTHCHQRSVLDGDADRSLLHDMGFQVDEPEDGCCGVAGAFGFEAGEHHRVSRAIGEQHLLPAARAAAPGDHLAAAGFSCREQIAQGTGREARHPIELVAEALRASGSRSSGVR
jgi:FAD/FMN-containing dehydrogenase/Fe-S oxidoreductase